MRTVVDTSWLLASNEPWTRYRTLIDLEHEAPSDPRARAARIEMVSHPSVRQLLAHASEWPGYPLRRHNDAAHPIHAISTLADFGLNRSDSGVADLAESILQHFDGDQFETLLWVPRFLTKEDDIETWSWMLCDAPILLYALGAFGYAEHPLAERAITGMLALADANGWRCRGAASLPRFSGPGRSTDTCPMATTAILKALSLIPDLHDHEAVQAGVEALLAHWEHQHEYKLRMFGIGTDFRKLKYPFVWYDILHVSDILSRYPVARRDGRFRQMVDEMRAGADAEGRFRATSMYRSWSDWSFADKAHPSPWITLLVTRVQARLDTV